MGATAGRQTMESVPTDLITQATGGDEFATQKEKLPE